MTVSADQLLAAYPYCQQAVAFVELILCESPEPGEQSAWGMMMSATTPMTPRDVLGMIQTTLGELVDEGEEGRHAEALLQTEHPSFLTYLCGKMGSY